MIQAQVNLTNNKDLLHNYKEEKTVLRCANKTLCTFDRYGQFEFSKNNHHIKLDRVLYSKNVEKNMLSGVRTS